MQANTLSQPAAWFLQDYHACRTDFLRRCDNQHLPHQQLQWNLTLPGETSSWSSDAIYFGNPSANKVLVIISGTHGVEGYCGSALQRFFLAELAAQGTRLAEDKAVVMLHALNPWGMDQARRCDHQGIDLNRNFIDFNQTAIPHPDYEHVLACMQLDSISRRQQLQQLQQQWGQSYFDKVLSGGQYHINWAPFYGGQSPAHAQTVINELIAQWSLAGRELLVMDLHTGLGPWGYGELISDHPSGSNGNHFARQLLGQSVAVTAEGGSFSVPKQGLLDYRWHQLMEDSGCFLTLEFGSYGTDALFEVLLDDHDLWRRKWQLEGSVSSNEQASIRQRMVEHFCPQDHLWQQSVLMRGWQLFHYLLDSNVWR
ncbi:DUF2817 domain-containing protein [Oceanicoccus sp. KOV_DT_Chl]|uniref:DUF2817 domain-containing protein n=1 Tax=Oceanicoccus sp. KOV_DT_Chl TaxID=1904639 RepID=UPI000C7D8192|nr:DUF2817 domain-containing protein [Oceanicoccus sp. KOV_DT_Chl]